MLFVLLGLAAGVLTTVAGLGGGVALVVLLSLVHGPHVALTTTAPALLVGNVHRLVQHWRALDRSIAGWFVVGAVPGAVLGGLLSARLPETAVAWIIVGVTAFALARGAGLVTWTPRPSMFLPFAFGAGTVAGSSGAGVIVAPVLVAGGLTGEALVATGSAAAIALHVGRISGYGMAGLFGGDTLAGSALLALGIVGGNVIGGRVRTKLGDERCMKLTHVVAVLCVVGAIASALR